VAKKQIMTGFPSLSMFCVLKIFPFNVFKSTDGNGNFRLDKSSCAAANIAVAISNDVRIRRFIVYFY
jgi:hypothetical protein